MQVHGLQRISRTLNTSEMWKCTDGDPLTSGLEKTSKTEEVSVLIIQIGYGLPRGILHHSSMYMQTGLMFLNMSIMEVGEDVSTLKNREIYEECHLSKIAERMKNSMMITT